jgi:hypothetical protein
MVFGIGKQRPPAPDGRTSDRAGRPFSGFVLPIGIPSIETSEKKSLSPCVSHAAKLDP